MPSPLRVDRNDARVFPDCGMRDACIPNWLTQMIFLWRGALFASAVCPLSASRIFGQSRCIDMRAHTCCLNRQDVHVYARCSHGCARDTRAARATPREREVRRPAAPRDPRFATLAFSFHLFLHVCAYSCAPYLLAYKYCCVFVCALLARFQFRWQRSYRREGEFIFYATSTGGTCE